MRRMAYPQRKRFPKEPISFSDYSVPKRHYCLATRVVAVSDQSFFLNRSTKNVTCAKRMTLIPMMYIGICNIAHLLSLVQWTWLDAYPQKRSSPRIRRSQGNNSLCTCPTRCFVRQRGLCCTSTTFGSGSPTCAGS